MAKAKRPPPSVVEAIDRALLTVNAASAGAEQCSPKEALSRGIVRLLLEAQELAEALQAWDTPGADEAQATSEDR
jgi:hypothetical protein